MKLDICISGCDSDDQTDEVLVDVLLALRHVVEQFDLDLNFSSDDTHVRTFGT